MHDVDETRLGELRLRQRRGYPQDRFVGEEGGAFSHRKHVAGEAEAAHIVDQIFAEAAGAIEPGDLRAGETQGFEKIERLFEAGGEQESAPRRQRPDE